MKLASLARTALAAAALSATALCALAGEETAVLRPADLRADKVPEAAVLRSLPGGTKVEVLSLEGGWAWVSALGQRGWMRAGNLDLRAERSGAAQVPSGRFSAADTVSTLGVRSLPARSNRHALIIGISRYKDPSFGPLPGAKIDRESATQMAQAMQIPPSNIHYLQDDEATGDAIRQALRELDAKAGEGDRVFIHFSGHGTRYLDKEAGGCVEALLAHDGGVSGTISNREMAQLLSPLARKTDKMFVMYDACHSGGVAGADSSMRSRGILVKGDEGRLRPKFTSLSDECSRPVNVKGRNLVVESQDKGGLPQDLVHISSSRDNEISFDDEQKGGLATQFMRDCMLRDAVDLDGSGAISIDEIRVCAQGKINKRMENDAYFKAHNLMLTGNAGFVPAWFSAQQLAGAAPPAPASIAAAPVTMPPPPVVAGAQALQQLFEQRDGKREVRVSVPSAQLKIGRDALDLTVQSSRKGFLYVAMAGSDNQALYVIFPNDLDANNAIEAGKPFKLPREGWAVRAGGPAGTNQLLVMVTDAPRDLAPLSASKAGPFVKSLNDQGGRATLGALMTRAKGAGVSDAFGAALLKVEEIR